MRYITGVMYNFNPRSPHGERLGVTTTQEMLESISIHAPRTGSDKLTAYQRPWWEISIHAPRTGSDALTRCARLWKRFQSTLPARGATQWD